MVGKRATSLAVWSLTRGRNSSRKAKDSLGVLYIFQLAAISGLRMCESVFHLHGVEGREEGLDDLEGEATGDDGRVLLHESGDLLDGQVCREDAKCADLAAGCQDRGGKKLGAVFDVGADAFEMGGVEREVL